MTRKKKNDGEIEIEEVKKEPEDIEIESVQSEAEPEEEDDAKAEAEAQSGAKSGAEAEAGADENGDAPEEGAKSDASQDDETWSEKYTRLMADFQNFRKRTDKEKADVYSFANEKIMTDLLAVLDNFERALDSECKDEAYAEGMKMIFKQLQDILTASGLEVIDAVGQDFDPNFHHAVLTDNNEDFDSGKVTEVLQKGYKLNGKVINYG
jgi:molecular chaperone GrpE